MQKVNKEFWDLLFRSLQKSVFHCACSHHSAGILHVYGLFSCVGLREDSSFSSSITPWLCNRDSWLDAKETRKRSNLNSNVALKPSYPVPICSHASLSHFPMALFISVRNHPQGWRAHVLSDPIAPSSVVLDSQCFMISLDGALYPWLTFQPFSAILLCTVTDYNKLDGLKHPLTVTGSPKSKERNDCHSLETLRENVLHVVPLV